MLEYFGEEIDFGEKFRCLLSERPRARVRRPPG
jgi:hypothetical protein